MNRILNIIFLCIVVVAGYVYRDTLSNVWLQSFNRYFPCKISISYSIDSFDTRFGISEKDFLSALKDAEAVWEKSINKDLFKHKANGSLKINLVYDERQKTTTELKKIENVVDSSKDSYDRKKLEYDEMVSSYNLDRKVYESRVANFEQRKIAYENEVSSVNQKGGANKETYNRLNSEKNYLSNELREINEMQTSLNSKIKTVNNLTFELNNLAKSLNLNVKKFNTIGGSLGEEFEEGTYTSDINGQRIDIYQFENRTKLVRVLAHELGHALGLDHNEDPKAIMYRLNNGVNEKLTNTDLVQLKNHCGI